MRLRLYQKIIIGFYIICFLVFGLSAWIIYRQTNFNKPLLFYALDVGQGDALLIRTPQNNTILIDGGPDNSVLYGLGDKLPFYDREIDLLILTHPDSDHVTGLVEILNRHNVRYVMATSVVTSSAVFSQWVAGIKKNKIEVVSAEELDKFYIEQDLTLEIIYPREKLSSQDLKSINNSSIVARLIYKDVAILLTGDLEREEKLVGNNFLKADILKVGHHGAENANSQKFIKAVSPKFAVISAGRDNRFGHPSQATLDRLNGVSAQILRTDLLGDVLLATDGNSVWQVTE
jgi:competence protein ComEC